MRIVFRTFFALTITLMLISCSAFASQVDIDLQETAIYSLLLSQDPAGYIFGTPIVILDETEYYEIENIRLLQKDMPSLEYEAFRNYQISNQEPQMIKLSLSLNKPYDFIDKSELNNLIEEYDNWDRFNQKYPEAHVYTFFSKIGFNMKGNQALVYMAHSCGGECGQGNLYFLVFDNNRWTIEGVYRVWIS